jgi:hypothetical protein
VWPLHSNASCEPRPTERAIPVRASQLRDNANGPGTGEIERWIGTPAGASARSGVDPAQIVSGLEQSALRSMTPTP